MASDELTRLANARQAQQVSNEAADYDGGNKNSVLVSY